MEQWRADELAHLLRGLHRLATVAVFGTHAQIDTAELIAANIAVGVDGTLGPAGGARGVKNTGVVIGSQVDIGHCLLGIGAADQGGELIESNQSLIATSDLYHFLKGGNARGGIGQCLSALQVGKDQSRTGVLKGVFQLCPRPPGIEGYDDGTDGHRCPKDHRPFGVVAHGQCHPVSLGNTVILD